MLLSYAKIVIFKQLLDSDVPEDPYLSKELVRYFPKPLQEDYIAEAWNNHRLRREIIATAVTNSMVNRMGSTFLLRMQEDTGETPAQIAKAYTHQPRSARCARVLGAASTRSTSRSTEAAQIDALTGHLAPAAQHDPLAAEPAGRHRSTSPAWSSATPSR